MESRPSSGPIVRFSTTATGSGSAPPRRSTARSRADSSVNPPSITPRPPGIGLLMTGELITRLSSTIVRYLPMFFEV